MSILFISIHALREEGDAPVPHRDQFRGAPFLSTPSARRATYKSVRCFILYDPFLSTPSARRATERRAQSAIDQQISIHALREEGDHRAECVRGASIIISIHALREEGDYE